MRLVAALSLSLLMLALPARAEVAVVDGDTIRVDGERVRLWGIDAPERLQRCTIRGIDRAIGQEASEGLSAILAGGELRCATKDHDRYGRTVALCWAGSEDISEAMVRLGWAWALPRYSRDRYLPAQQEAQQARRGIWADERFCEAPAQFRHRRK